MSDDKRMVTLTKSSGTSWADEDDSTTAPPEPKTAKTWGSVAQVQAASLEEIQQEEAKKAALAKESAPPYRAPREYRDTGARREPHDYASSGASREGAYRPREPRPKNPVPDHPPYVAFLGNLSYSVNEDAIYDYFGELGVDQVRMVTDADTGRPKGIAYIHFTTREALEQALEADGVDFYGRQLNVDVALPKDRDRERGQWGPSSNRRGFGERGFGDRGFGDRGFGPRGGAPPAERKPLNLAPRTKPLDADDSPASDSSKPTSPEADPFGGAAADRAKLDKIAEERLRREQEREERRRQEIREAEERHRRAREERERQREEGVRGRGTGRFGEGRREPPKSEREAELDSRSSWRSDKKPGDFTSTRGSFAGRGGARGGAFSSPRAPSESKKWVQDEEGFKTKKADEKPSAPSSSTGGGSWAAIASKGTAAAEEKNVASNPYEALGSDD